MKFELSLAQLQPQLVLLKIGIPDKNNLFATLLSNNNNNNNNKKKNPHLNFLKGTVLGDKEQGVGIRDKG